MLFGTWAEKTCWAPVFRYVLTVFLLRGTMTCVGVAGAKRSHWPSTLLSITQGILNDVPFDAPCHAFTIMTVCIAPHSNPSSSFAAAELLACHIRHALACAGAVAKLVPEAENTHRYRWRQVLTVDSIFRKCPTKKHVPCNHISRVYMPNRNTDHMHIIHINGYVMSIRMKKNSENYHF